MLANSVLHFFWVSLLTLSVRLFLPFDKLVEFHDIVQAFLHMCRAKRRQLQSQAGKLSWDCKVVYGDRTFLRHNPGCYELLAVPLFRGFLYRPYLVGKFSQAF